MNIDEMTLEQVRDYIAEAQGWKRITGSLPVEVPNWERRTKLPSGAVGVEESWCCPVPATLDAAQSSLPEGWDWGSVSRMYGCDPERPRLGPCKFSGYGATACNYAAPVPQQYQVASDNQPDFKYAMFRAAAKAWQYVLKGEG